MIWHVLPINDIQEHEEDSTCKCNPIAEVLENGDILLIHNSFDGRELSEKGDLSPQDRKVFYLHLTYEGEPLLLPIYEDKLYLSIEQVSKILGLYTQVYLDYLNEDSYFKDKMVKLSIDPSDPDSEKECLPATDIVTLLWLKSAFSSLEQEVHRFMVWIHERVEDFSTTNIQK